MSSQTIAELAEAPIEPTIEHLLESLYQGTLEAHSVILSEQSTRPATPESDPEIVNTPPHSPEHQPEYEAEASFESENIEIPTFIEPEFNPESLFAEEVEHETEPVETAHQEEKIQVDHVESEELDIRTLGGSEGHTPATLEEATQSEPIPVSLQVPKKSKKSKRKESKKEKKKKKVAEEPVESEPLGEYIEEIVVVAEREEPSYPHTEEIQEDHHSAFHTSEAEADLYREVEAHTIDPSVEEPQEFDPDSHSIAQEVVLEEEVESAFEISEELYHDPEEVNIGQEPELDQPGDFDTQQDDNSAVYEHQQDGHDIYHPVEEIELEKDSDPVAEVPELNYETSPAEELLRDNTASVIEKSGQDQFQLQQDFDSAFEPSEEVGHDLFPDVEDPGLQYDIDPEVGIPEEADSDTIDIEDEPIFERDQSWQFSADQHEPSFYEPSPSEEDQESLVEDSATFEPEPTAEVFITIDEDPLFEETSTPEPEIEEHLSCAEPETELRIEEARDLVPEPYLEDLIVTEPEIITSVEEPLDRSTCPEPAHTEPDCSSRDIDCIISDPESPIQYPTPELRPLPEYASTVEEIPEDVNIPPPSVFSDIRMPETIAENTTNTSTMALQDRSLIASQLSDALALFNSFDESVKSLVTRLQSNENNFMTKPEHEGSTPTVSASFHVPFTRNPNFHGRFSILSQIFGMWRPQQRCRIGVAGLGGLGKTELVVEFVYRARQVSPNTPVFWFGPDDIRSKETSTSATAGLQLEDWLRGHHDRGSMLVVDSGDRSDLYETTSDRGSFVDRLRNFEGTVILVSRNARDGNLIARPHEICEVRELELDACVNLMCDHLETYAHDASTEREIQEVVKSLNCIPRAIIQVAKVINSTQMTVSQFYGMYSTGEPFQLRLLSRIDPYSKPDHDLSVIGRGIFDLRSFRKLQAEPSRLLYQIYYLGGKSVPCSLVSTDDPLNKILLMLTVRAHFIIDEDLSNDTFSIHPMVYLAMRKALGSERPLSDESEMLEERKWYDEVVLSFSKHYPDANCESRAWWKECFAHLISGYNLHSDILRIAIATIYHRESSFFKRKGIFSEALKMASLARSVLPDPVPSECLIIVQDQITLLDFLAKYREVHEMLRGLSMEVGHPGNLWKKSMMAKLEVADCANRYDTAIEIFRQVRTAGDAANADKLDLANATDDLSMALMQKGKYREAAAECRKALGERSSRLGSSHTDTLSSCHNLAEILHKDGKFEESHRYIQEALRGRETVLGPEHPETLSSKVLRARIQISKATTTGEFDEAEAVLNYAMERLGAKLSPSHPIVMTCKSEIARIMFARGKYETAEAMNQSVLAAREQGPWLEPATHPDTMTSRNQLADVIRLKDGSKAADNLSERCLTERTVVLTNGSLTGEDFHPDQLASLHNRAVILSGLGQHLAALQKIDLALLGRKAILGEHHPDYFISMTWKGEIMRAQLHRYQSERTQTLDTIENLHKQAYEGLSWILGSEHQSSLQCATHMALAKRERGSPASSEAEGLFRQIHCAYQHNMGDFHPETLKSKGRLAEAMRAASPRHHLEAKKLWRDSCGGLTRIYGFDAHVTANAYKGYEKFLRAYPDP